MKQLIIFSFVGFLSFSADVLWLDGEYLRGPFVHCSATKFLSCVCRFSSSSPPCSRLSSLRLECHFDADARARVCA